MRAGHREPVNTRVTAHGLAGYARRSLTGPRWSETTKLCGRGWAATVGGDGGRFGEAVFAPTCRRCLALLDRHVPTLAPDNRLVLVAQLAADVVVDRRGFAKIDHVHGDQQDWPRKAVRTAIRRMIASPPTSSTSAGRTVAVPRTPLDCLLGGLGCGLTGAHEQRSAPGAGQPGADRDGQKLNSRPPFTPRKPLPNGWPAVISADHPARSFVQLSAKY